MNRKVRQLLLLMGLLLVVSIATLITSFYEEKQEQISTTEDVILAVETADATAISWEFEDEDAEDEEAASGSFTFTLTDGAWVYEDDESFPTDTEAIESLLEVFSEFTAAFIIEDVDDYSQYGLSDPCAEITITTDDGDYVIELGDFSTMDAQRYVSVGDGNVYLVSVDPMDYYALALSDLIDNDEAPSFDAVTTVDIDGDETYTITYEEESTYAYSEEDVYFTDATGGTTPLDADAVDDYLSTISSLDLTDYLTYSLTDDDLADYGLDAPELVVTVAYTDIVTDEDGEETEESGTFVITVARDADQIEAALEAEEEEDTDTDEEEGYAAYVRIGDSAIVYGIDSSTYTSLMAVGYTDLCHLELVPFDESEIVLVDIALDGETYTFTTAADEEDEETIVWYYEEEEIDGSDFESELTGLSLTERDDAVEEGTEEISVTVTLSNANYSSVSFTLYRYDGESCTVYVDGEALGLVSRSDAMDLVEAVNSIVLN